MFRRSISAILPCISIRYEHPVVTMSSADPASSRTSTRQSTPEPSTSSRPVQFYRRLLPPTCISFSSLEGKEIFKQALQSGHMEGYFGLAAQFRTQDEPAFCGLSTLVMVLNTLEVDPKRVWKGVWRWYHEEMLDCCVTLEHAAKLGITMDEFACVASCNTLNVNMVRATENASEEEFRTVVRDLTKATDEVVVLSYSRKVLGQTGDGHFSPVGGYNPERDLVLMLDTARFKYPPHWVSLPLLFKSMQALDKTTGQPRGYLRLRRSDTVPLVLFRWDDSLSLPMLDANQQQSQGITKFLSEWDKWLFVTPGPQEPPMSCNDTLLTAVDVFTAAISHISPGESILTTQVDNSCTDTLSSEHSCIVQDLLKAVEGLPLYEMVKDHLNNKADLADHISNCLDRQLKCRVGNEEIQQKAASASAAECSCELMLKAPHFITMLMLVWPTPRCGENMGNIFRRAAQGQISNANSVLQYEVSQLSRQINTLMKHQQRYQNCYCSKPIKVTS